MQQTGTYQTRTADYAGLDRSAGDAVLAAYGELYGRVQRKLFADVAAGSSAASLKSAYLERYGIPARMFNAVRVSLEGQGRRRSASSRSCGRMLWGGALRGLSGRFPMPLKVADGIRFIRRNGGWPICESQAGCTGRRHCCGPSAAVLRVPAAVAQAAPFGGQWPRQPSRMAGGVAGFPQ